MHTAKRSGLRLMVIGSVARRDVRVRVGKREPDTLGRAAPIKPDVGVNEAALSPVFLQPLSCYAQHLRLKYRPVCVPRCPAQHLHRCISYSARTRWQGHSLVVERVFHPNRTRFSTSQLQRFSVATVVRTLNVNDCPKAAAGFQITTPRRVLPV